MTANLTLGFQFDVAEDDSEPVDAKLYNFVFDLKDLLNVRRKSSTFIQLDLFDASSTMTFMLFRGSEKGCFTKSVFHS